jgi:hypothetical protein
MAPPIAAPTQTLEARRYAGMTTARLQARIQVTPRLISPGEIC